MKYRVHALWEEYRRKVMHADAPPIQVTETRRAFYAGIQGVLNLLGAEMSPGDAVDDPSDEKAVAEVHEELLEFARDLMEGRA